MFKLVVGSLRSMTWLTIESEKHSFEVTDDQDRQVMVFGGVHCPSGLYMLTEKRQIDMYIRDIQYQAMQKLHPRAQRSSFRLSGHHLGSLGLLDGGAIIDEARVANMQGVNRNKHHSVESLATRSRDNKNKRELTGPRAQ